MGISLALLYMGVLGLGSAITPGVGMAGALLALCPQGATNYSHLPAYGLLTWLLAKGLKQQGCSERMALRLAMAAAMMFGLCMEVMQGFVPGRFVEAGDVLLNAMGIGLAALMIRSAPERRAYASVKRSWRRLQ